MKKTQINLTDLTTEEIGEFLGNIAEKSESKVFALCNFACILKQIADNRPEIKDGEEYELHLGNGFIGDVFYLASKKGVSHFDFEFDNISFNKMGYDAASVMKATMMLTSSFNR